MPDIPTPTNIPNDDNFEQRLKDIKIFTNNQDTVICDTLQRELKIYMTSNVDWTKTDKTIDNALFVKQRKLNMIMNAIREDTIREERDIRKINTNRFAAITRTLGHVCFKYLIHWLYYSIFNYLYCKYLIH